MALHGYLIERYNNMAGSYTCYRLMEEAAIMGMDLQLIGIEDTYIQDGVLFNNGKRMQPCDFVINRFKIGKLREQINALARRTYNPSDAFARYINKYDQVRTLHSDEFIIPQYILSTTSCGYETLASHLGSPFVAKGLESSMGREIFLIKREEDLTSLQKQFGSTKEWLFEEFIAESKGRDVRLFAIRDTAIAAMIRKSEDDFRANVALGASVESIELTPAIQQIARDIYAITHLDFVGIDLLFGKDKFYLCEINVMPGLEGIEKASGVNISRHIIETIRKDFSNE